MAKRMKLVPDTWTDQFGTEADQAVQPSSSKADDVIEFPERIRKKADQIWPVIKTMVRLNSSQQVIYDDQTVGSHIADLLEYFLLPPSKLRPRPFDSDKFFAVITAANDLDGSLLDKRFSKYLTNINSSHRGDQTQSTHRDTWIAF